MSYITDDEKAAESDLAVYAELTDERASQHAQIYKNAYRIRLSNALQTVYPALLRLLGKKAFAALSQDYLATYSPRDVSLKNYPKQLPQLLSCELSKNNSLVELAEFERDCYYLAPDNEAIRLTSEDWKARVELDETNKLFIKVSPHAILLELNYNTEQVWQVLRDKQASLESVSDKGVLWLWKKDDNGVDYGRLNAKTASFAKLLLSGLTFERACYAFSIQCGDSEHALTLMSACMNDWLALGLLVIG